MLGNHDAPIQFKGPLKVLGPIGNGVQPEDQSYSLYSEQHGVIGYWPKLDVHPDGYWRMTEAEAQFIADACNEKIEREREQLALEVQESQCRYECDDHREIEDTEGNTWPCPLHGDHAQGRKNDDPIGENLMTGELMSGEAIYTMMMNVAVRSYAVAMGSEMATLHNDQIRKVVDSVLAPKRVGDRELEELLQD